MIPRRAPIPCLVVLVVLAWTAAAAEVPAGAEIAIRLSSKVTSNSSKPGDVVQAVVIAPVAAREEIVVPAGTVLTGVIREATPSKPGERAGLRLLFQQLAGKKFSARVLAVDNARESVDEAGRIVGIQESETITAQMDRGLEKLGGRAGRLAEFLQTAKSALLKKADVEIAYEPGVEMTLLVTECLEAGKLPASHLAGIDEEAELDSLVNRQPFQTRAGKPPTESDITNLMFIGSREQVQETFLAAGWATAAALSAAAKFETFRAIAEGRGYKEAPMSILLLEGKKPDLVFQKQLNTFAKRHHLRIWSRPQSFQGQPVWVSAATHDIGIEFSPENKTFIHKIDSRIDRERAKVVNDLVLTGRVGALALVGRPAVPRQSRNATGDQLETDGAMAVLGLK